jgi:hypothetical protein
VCVCVCVCVCVFPSVQDAQNTVPPLPVRLQRVHRLQGGNVSPQSLRLTREALQEFARGSPIVNERLDEIWAQMLHFQRRACERQPRTYEHSCVGTGDSSAPRPHAEVGLHLSEMWWPSRGGVVPLCLWLEFATEADPEGMNSCDENERYRCSAAAWNDGYRRAHGSAVSDSLAILETALDRFAALGWAISARTTGGGGGSLRLAELRASQAGRRHTLTSMAALVDHVRTGGGWSDSSQACSVSDFRDAKDTGVTDCVTKGDGVGDGNGGNGGIVVVRFEDGAHFVRDGHHRLLAMLAAGRCTLGVAEYTLEDWHYADWGVPNITAGFLTPLDPREELRRADWGEYREALKSVLNSPSVGEGEGWEVAERRAVAYIKKHREGYIEGGSRVGRNTLAEMHLQWARGEL